MAYASPSPVPAPAARPRGPLPYLATGCGLIGLCLLCAVVAGGGYFIITQRTVTSAGGPAVEYILDATSRMAQQAAGENDTRLNVARGVLAEIVRPSDPAVTAGLRVFGTGAQSVACSDTALLVPLATANQGTISTHLLSITSANIPDAAMAQAMISAIRDLSATKGKHTLVVVAGGADSCSPQAGQLIAAEAQKSGIDLQLFIVGYQVSDGDGNAIKGLVDSVGGSFVKADTKEQLNAVLAAIQQYAQDQKAATVSNVVATAAAAVGTANVVSQGTPLPPLGTAVPGNIVTPVPSDTPGSSHNPTPTTAATAVATQGGPGQTACDHPYFPMRPGSTWTFSGDQGNLTWTVTDVTGDQTDATATMQWAVQQVTGTYHWHCTPNGIDSYDFGSVNTGTGGAVEFKLINHTGVWLLPAAQLTQGAQWDSTYSLQATAGGVSFTDDVVEHFTAGGTESITAAGETHDALRIDTTSSFTISGAVSNSVNVTSSYWLVRGIGPVQWTASVAGGNKVSSVLQSYSIPK
jgi:hypothetical protein